MKQAKSIRRDNYKKALTSLLEREKEAHKVVNRYKVMNYLLSKEWSNSMKNGFEDIKDFLQDVTYCDRIIRLYTEGEEEEEKEILSQEFQINELPNM